MQIAREGALAEPRGNCLLDLGAETWQGGRVYVRAGSERGDGPVPGAGCQGPAPPAPSEPCLGLLPARTGAGGGRGGGEGPQFQFSSLGAALRRPVRERGSEEHCWRGGCGRPGLGNADAPQMALGFRVPSVPPGKLGELGTTQPQMSCL